METATDNAQHISNLQHPLNSRFTAASTAEEVIEGIDLKGKIAIVTGGYSGIGLETARVLLNAGARVIVPARDLDKAARNLETLPGVEIESLDLINPASIDAFAERFLATGLPLHILVNSAGIMANPLTRDSRGYESQFATNHLGHFQLTARLWSALKKANGARVVAVSSRGHRYSPVVFNDINFTQRPYEPMLAYGQSKTANILFALQLDKIGQAHSIRAFSVHPGIIVDTDLARHIPGETFAKMGVLDTEGKPKLDPLKQLKNVQQGASTSVWCATSPSLNNLGGVYCENNNIAGMVGGMVVTDAITGADAHGNFGVLPYAVDEAAAERLWALSQEMAGLRFN